MQYPNKIKMTSSRNILEKIINSVYVRIHFFPLILTKLLVTRVCYTVSREEETKESFFEFMEICTKITAISNKRHIFPVNNY